MKMARTPLYDVFSHDYDRFVGWAGRLAYELPFIQRQLEAVGARRVLDAACGTGRHALALAANGYQVVGADLSAGMIQQALENAAAVDEQVRFVTAGFGELASRVGTGFDALLCLGNSLPHALSLTTLEATLNDFSAVLRPGGLLLVQNRNFDAVLANRDRWMEPQAHREGEREWLFIRFYNFNPDATLTFNLITLSREGKGPWRQSAQATRLMPWQASTLLEQIAAAGFGEITAYGDMTGANFEPGISGNLILTAKR
jgi:SAM-dependent methyltransferase